MPPKIIIAGAPASGKGTQCEFIKAEYGCVHLSTGDMLRAAVKAGTPLGTEAKGHMDSGGLVPDQLIIDIIIARLAEADCMEKGWLLDGFPRTRAQADALSSAGLTPDAFLLLDVPDEMLVERVVGRRSDPETGIIYHVKFKPPPNDEIASRLEQRSDDTEEAIMVRIKAFHENVNAIIGAYTSNILRVDGNRDPNLVWAQLRANIPKMYKKEAVFMLGGPGSDRDGVAAALATQHTDHTLINVDELLASAEGIEKDKELIHEAMKNGKLVDAVTVTTAIKCKIMSSPGKKFLLNGFPRSKAELDQWAEMCSGDVFYDSVLYIDSALETMKANLLANEATAPIANTLLSTFVGSTIPIFDLFSRANKLRVIPTDGLPSAVSIEKASRIVRANSVLRPYERTFAMIKPDAVSAAGAVPAILEAIAGVNLSVVYTKLVQLTDDVAGAFYAEHSARPFFPRLKQFMTSGPVLVMVLEGTDAIRAWRTLMGPTNTQVAEKEAPNSLRARFGTDGTMNATHGSDAVHTAMREIDFWTNPECPGGGLTECILPSEMPEAQLDDFGEEMKLSEEEEMQKKLAMCASDIPAGTPLAVQDTYAMIKPLIAERNYTEIMDVLSAQGFTVVAETKVRLSHTQVELFYEEHKERPFFPTLVEYMTSGPVVALHLRREFAIGAWRHLIGPTNFDKAKNERPDSLRALFALDGTRNACHGSDSAGSARRELGFFFSIGACAPDLLLQDQLATTVSSGSPAKVATSSVPPVSPPKRYAGQVRAPPQINKADIALMEAYANYDVEPVMKELLQQLMITRPADVTGFALQTLASMHMKKGQELPAFPAESGVPLNRLNPIIASPRGGEASMDGKDPLPAIEDDAESTAAVGGE